VKLQDIQNLRLKAVLRHAYENVPFYRRKFDQAGIRPDEIKSFDDLSKLPVTTKAEIQTSSLKDLVARNTNIHRCVKTMTGGSTGLPLTVLGDERAGDFCSALWGRALLENGLRLSDRVAHIKNPDFFPRRKGIFRLLKRKYISVLEDLNRQLEMLEHYRPDIIRGYASSLALIATASIDRENRVRPRLVFNGGELLPESCRSKISSSLECDVLDFYGAAEFSLLMWECSAHAGYHMNVESVAIEFLKKGEVVSPGETGEIIVTNLHNYVMPLIRYNLGDMGIPMEEQCPCGRTLPLTKVLIGRSDDLLTTLDGRPIYASSFFYSLFGNPERIRQYKVVQERKDKLAIQLVPAEGFSFDDSVLNNTRREIQEVFGRDMRVDFRLVEKIERESSGKLRAVKSKVPVKLTNGEESN
jgi:phenylacetate-CoA ligase